MIAIVAPPRGYYDQQGILVTVPQEIVHALDEPFHDLRSVCGSRYR